MSNSAQRFLRMVGLVLAAMWLGLMVKTYLVGSHGLNFHTYLKHLGLTAFYTGFGFLLVYGALAFAKAHPKPSGLILVAPPRDNMPPALAELMGFVQGYQHWPAPLPAGNLYHLAQRRLAFMQGIPDTGPLHHMVALASVLPVIAATDLHTARAPWWHVGKQDVFSFHQRQEPLGSLAPALLESLPAYATIPALEQAVIATTLTYMDEPHAIPATADPRVFDVVGKLAFTRQNVG